MRKEDKLYTVYRLENIVTKKNYIGMTSRNPKRRWSSGYNGKMGDAIHQFPFDLCWKKHIEFQTPNKEQALELEAELMKWYDSVENGYNTSPFGSSHIFNEELKKKISESLSGEKHPFYGKHFTEEHRKHISESHTGKHFTEEHKNKLSEAMTGNQNATTTPVLQYSKSGDFIAEYSSTMEAERKTGYSHSHIIKCCKGKLKSTGGYIWKYKSNTN